MTFNKDPNYGIGNYTLKEGEKPETAETLIKHLQDHFSSPAYQPPVLPSVAIEVNNMAQKADVDVVKVVQLLEKDPLLAARILRTAQSAAFASSSAIQSLKDAIVRIGLRNLSQIVWEVTTSMRIFRSKAFEGPMDEIRKHSTATAHLARLVSSFTSVATEYAFLCGLLHDIGMAAALIVFGEQKGIKPPKDDWLMATVLKQAHESCSQSVAKLWKLPGDLQIVLGSHHAVVTQGFVHPLSAVVAVAEELAGEAGFGLKIGTEAAEATSSQALKKAHEALALDEKRMILLREQAKKLKIAVDAHKGA
jgi:HD-like signal output (HDOD) protein